METPINHHPVYVSGQYLTSEDLNDTQNFLWEQQLFTRAALIGNGILQGLHVTETNGAQKLLAVSAGAASTIDGLALQFAEPQVLDKGASFHFNLASFSGGKKMLVSDAQLTYVQKILKPQKIDGINAVELFKQGTAANLLPANTTGINAAVTAVFPVATALVLVCWLDKQEVENDNCLQGNCDTKGITRTYKTRYFLVQPNLLSASKGADEMMQYCRVARIKNLAGSGSTAGFNKAVADAWNACCIQLEPYFKIQSAVGSVAYSIKQMPSAIKNEWSQAISMFDMLRKPSTSPPIGQYYLSFAEDLCQAINEFVEKHNQLAIRYKDYNEARIDSTIVFGKVSQDSFDSYRYYFIPAYEQRQYATSVQEMEAMVMRLSHLLQKFITADKFNKTPYALGNPKYVPTATQPTLLQHRAIPPYYAIGNNLTEFINHWTLGQGSLNDAFTFYDDKIPQRGSVPDMLTLQKITAWNKGDFFSIYGHIGLTKTVALAAIKKLILEEALPIQVLDCDVDYKGPQKWYEWYNGFTLFVNESLSSLRAINEVKNYPFDPLKKIQTLAAQTSYRKPEEVKNILNDFTSYTGVFHNMSIEKKVGGNAKGTKAAGIPITAEVIEAYKKVVTEAKLKTLLDGYYEAVKEVQTPDTKSLIVLKDLLGLEYQGGAFRGGTFVLLHSGGKIIGDGCLPFFYVIEKARVI